MIGLMKKDSVWVGIGIGLFCPVALYSLFLLLYYFLETIGVFNEVGFADDFRTRTLALVSICANLLIMQSYRKSHRHHETIRGILIASMILVGVWFWMFGLKILQS